MDDSRIPEMRYSNVLATTDRKEDPKKDGWIVWKKISGIWENGEVRRWDRPGWR